MEKSKLINPAVITAVTFGATIAAPHIALFILLPLTSLIGDIFSQEELERRDSLGKINLDVISGILTNPLLLWLFGKRQIGSSLKKTKTSPVLWQMLIRNHANNLKMKSTKTVATYSKGKPGSSLFFV